MKTRISLGVVLGIGALAILGQTKVTLCHNVDHNPHTITVAAPAAVAHFLQHPSDTLGPCGESGGEDGIPQG